MFFYLSSVRVFESNANFIRYIAGRCCLNSYFFILASSATRSSYSSTKFLHLKQTILASASFSLNIYVFSMRLMAAYFLYFSACLRDYIFFRLFYGRLANKSSDYTLFSLLALLILLSLLFSRSFSLLSFSMLASDRIDWSVFAVGFFFFF